MSQQQYSRKKVLCVSLYHAKRKGLKTLISKVNFYMNVYEFLHIRWSWFWCWWWLWMIILMMMTVMANSIKEKKSSAQQKKWKNHLKYTNTHTTRIHIYMEKKSSRKNVFSPCKNPCFFRIYFGCIYTLIFWNGIFTIPSQFRAKPRLSSHSPLRKKEKICITMEKDEKGLIIKK